MADAKLEIVVSLKDKASKQIAGLRGKMAGLGKMAGKVMKVGLLAGGVAIAAAGAAALKFGNDFIEAKNIIRAGTGAVGDSLGALYDDFKAAFADVPGDMKVVAQTTADLNTALGLTGKPLQTLTKQVVELGRVTDTDVAAILPKVTRMYGDWSVATEDQSEALDKVFKASQATGAPVERLMGLMVSFGAPLRQLDFTIEESAALLGKWEKEGVNTELVMGSLKIAIAKFAKEGVPLRKGLEETIARIQELGPGAESTSIAMEKFGARAGGDMAAAILEGKFSIDELVDSIDASDDSIMKVAEDTRTWQEKLQILRNKALVKLEPLMVGFVELIGDLADWLGVKVPLAIRLFVGGFTEMDVTSSGLHGKIEQLGIVLRAAWEVLKDVADLLNRTLVPALETMGEIMLTKVLPAMRDVFDFVRDNKPVLAALATVIAVPVVLAMIAWTKTTYAHVTAEIARAAATIAANLPLYALVAVLALAVAGIVLLIQNWDQIVAFIKTKVIPIFEEVWTAIKEWVIGAFESVISYFTDTVGPFFSETIPGYFTGLRDDVMGIINEVVGFLEDNWKTIVQVALAVLFPPGAGLFWIITHFGTIKETVRGIIDDIVGFVTGIPATIGSFGQSFYNAASGLFKRMANGAVRGINALIGVVESGFNWLIDTWNGLSFELPKVGPIGGGTISTPDVGRISIPRVPPQLEHGGLVEQTGLAIIHQGEAVIPKGGGINIYGDITIVAADPEDFVRQLRRYAAA